MNALSLIAAEQASGGILNLLILVLPLGLLFYMMVVPQRKQKQKHAAFVSSLGVGDDVVTAGGMYGTISFMEDDVVHLEVDTDVVIRVSKGSLSRAAVESPVEAPTRGRGLLGGRAPAATGDAPSSDPESPDAPADGKTGA